MENVSLSNSLGERVPKLRFPGFEGEWRLINISELLDFQNGINADSDKYGSGIKYISVSDILNNPYICYDDIKGLVDIDNSTLEHYKVEYGDIVFQRSSETFEDIGHANVYLDKSRPATFGGFVIRGKKKGNYNPFFFKNLLDTPYARKATTRMGAGAQHYNISQDGLSKIALYFPKINEQEKIADLFMILNKKIQLQKELVKSLKLYKRGLLSKLFPRNGESMPQYRFKGFTDAWKQCKVGDISSIIAGGTPSTNETCYWEPKEIPWLSSGEVHKKYVYHTAEMISKKGLSNSSAKWVEKGSVLIALAGQGKTRGTAAITRRPLTTNQSIAAIKFDNVMYPDYAFHNLDSRYDELRNISSGNGTRGGLNKQLLSNLKILFPLLKEQKKIGDFFSQIDHFITLHQEQCYSYEKIKFALLQKMFI